MQKECALRKKGGVIVNVISIDNECEFEGFENASSIVTGFTQSWAKELTPFNIRVGGVVPVPNYSAKKKRLSVASGKRRAN